VDVAATLAACFICAHICCTWRDRLASRRADPLTVGQKDILKICNQPDTHMDFGAEHEKTRNAG
jgi:hypothetical protein